MDNEHKQIDGQPEVPGEDEIVYLPNLLADEFGTTTGLARVDLALGTVYIDGAEQTEKFTFPRKFLLGKTIDVRAKHRHFTFVYNG
jgi:hypothetical protein